MSPSIEDLNRWMLRKICRDSPEGNVAAKNLKIVLAAWAFAEFSRELGRKK